ncbi:MAG: UDP-N-acetylmuramoyl-L-alanyl-D-glutamate--2,6-diaminopimelate ligase [Ilumatobacteraceae bacterium]
MDTDDTGLGRIRAHIDAGTLAGPVTHDSREVVPGSLYACLRGEHFDGHEFARQAIAGGASVLLTDHLVDGVDAGVQVVVDDTRRRLGPIAALVAGDPSSELTVVGITGTNGKTTTAQMLAAIFEFDGRPTGIVGTLHGPRTTPEAPELQRTLRGFVDAGKTAAVLEVSSHALSLHRVDGTAFDAVVYTNLGHDHLDLHGSREEYFRAKASLFSPSFAPVGVVNIDDTHGRLLADTAASADFSVIPFSDDDVRDVVVTASSHSYTWRDVHIDVPIGGRFNVSNSIAALTTAVHLGVDPAVAAGGLATLSAVPGRFEVVSTRAGDERGITVIVDYAHTPDGLDEVLSTSRQVVGSGGSLIVVFGCGGGRDRAKRPEMGAVAARLADRVVVTSDNPRREDPALIIGEIVEGIEPAARSSVTTNPDRRAAIGDALALAGRGDVVVIAGKGHERTQEFDGDVVEFDDRAVARQCLEDAS